MCECVCVCVCVHLEMFLNIKLFFSFGQNMKNITMVKVGYICMGQRMMWDNVVIFPFR
jgi:hypothetical protein